MNILEIIEKKKNKISLTESEINFVINNFVNDLIPEYQMSAFLMCILLNGMNVNETYFLTKAMMNSGKRINVSSRNKFNLIIDKHSSGGVGDKVSLIILPILVALGYDVAKLSGKGLSFTGGTIDKLDSINVKTNLTNYQELIDKYFMFNIMQSKEIVPADKKIYALRDVTGTVNSLPLIASSILSKKFIINSDYVFLDIKVGNGAFCKNIKEGVSLANLILKIAKKMKRKVIIHLTSMQKPLGRCIGNQIEIQEAIAFLKDFKQASTDLKTLIEELIVDILLATKKFKNKLLAKKEYEKVLDNQLAYKCAINYWVGLGADYESLKNNSFWNPKYKLEIKANKSGYINYLSAKEIGLIAVELKAGRKTKNDKLDYAAGIFLNKKTNEYVKFGETIATLYANDLINLSLEQRFLANVAINEEMIKLPKIILKIMK